MAPATLERMLRRRDADDGASLELPPRDLLDQRRRARSSEASYTRVISFKLFYYYTYLIIGLALLGIGAGRGRRRPRPRLRRARTGCDHRLGAPPSAPSSCCGGYVVIAKLPITTLGHLAVRDSGATRSATLASCSSVSFAVFAPFTMIGVVISTLVRPRRSDRIGRFYFADLVGVVLACGLVVFLIREIYPPASLMLGPASILALVALSRAIEDRRPKVLVPAVARARCADRRHVQRRTAST